MDEDQVVGFVGMPGAGKSSCVEYLENKGFPSAYFGGIIIEEVKKQGLAVNEGNEKKVREEIRRVEGNHAFARRIIKQVDGFLANGQHKVVVDGIYSWSEYKLFEGHFRGKLTIIAIAAPRKLRHERLGSREVRPLSMEEANARDYAEIENVEKGGPIANADYTIVNDGKPEAMIRKLGEILKDIKFV